MSWDIQGWVNRVHNKDAFESLKQLPPESINAIITDPPYGNNRGYGRSQLGHRTIEGDSNLNWLHQFAVGCYQTLKDPGFCVVFTQWRTIDKFRKVFEEAGFRIKTVAVWDKGKPGLGDGIAEEYENIIIFRKGKAKSPYSGNVFREPRVIGRPEHPHEKPLKLMERLVGLFSEEGDVVLDPFLGSGTTAVACKRLGRNFIGFEIKSEYCKIAEKRLKKTFLLPPEGKTKKQMKLIKEVEI